MYIYKTDVQHLSFSLAIGLHYAKGEFIARMDSDDISTPDRLELQVEYMINNPDIIVLGTCYELIDYKGHPIKKISLPLYNNDIRRTFIIGNPICHPSVMFRRKEIIDIGGYLGDIYAQDYDLWARLAMNKKYKFANLKKICLQYRVQGSGNARKSRLAYASMAGAQFRNFIYGAGISWFVGALISAFKAVIVSKK
ncbi:MAG: glycosyltransferase [Bacteroidetes bacterium]|nr:glycosyltransferase [Bacteroidota bacterium]